MKHTGKEIMAIIKDFNDGEDRELTVVNDSSWLHSKKSDSMYMKLRYYARKLNSRIKVTRNYNTIMLIK